MHLLPIIRLQLIPVPVSLHRGWGSAQETLGMSMAHRILLEPLGKEKAGEGLALNLLRKIGEADQDKVLATAEAQRMEAMQGMRQREAIPFI